MDTTNIQPKGTKVLLIMIDGVGDYCGKIKDLVLA